MAMRLQAAYKIGLKKTYQTDAALRMPRQSGTSS